MHAITDVRRDSVCHAAVLRAPYQGVPASGLDAIGDLFVAEANGSDSGPPPLSLHYVESFFGRELAHRLMIGAGMCRDREGTAATVSPADFWMLCLSNVNTENDENHGCGKQPMPKSTWGMVFSQVNQMDTVGSGLRRCSELAMIIGSGLSISLGYSGSSVNITYGVSDDVTDVERTERYAELMALVVHCMLLWCTDRPIKPQSVRLSSRLCEGDGSMADMLSPNRYRTGVGTMVTYDRADMQHPLGVRRYKSWAVHETTIFLELVAQFTADKASASGMCPPILTKLRGMLAHRNLSQQQAAASLGMSVATLQRRLTEAGHSFREISRDLRSGKLRSLLATDSSLDDIAVELGFSERRSLWRACHDWLGMSPASYRRRLRAQNGRG